jgi:hypothetical protein
MGLHRLDAALRALIDIFDVLGIFGRHVIKLICLVDQWRGLLPNVILGCTSNRCDHGRRQHKRQRSAIHKHSGLLAQVLPVALNLESHPAREICGRDQPDFSTGDAIPNPANILVTDYISIRWNAIKEKV